MFPGGSVGFNRSVLFSFFPEGKRQAFLDETRLGYVIIDTRRASERLQRFVVNVLRLVPIDAEGPYDVYVPASNHDPDGDSNGTKITVTRP